MSKIAYRTDTPLPPESIVTLFQSANWSSAQKPELLLKALKHSHTVVTAWDDKILVGLGSAISDGFMVAYFPYLVVLPKYQRQGIGTGIVTCLLQQYKGFHQLALIADGKAVTFYKSLGFEPAGNCQALWIYDGQEHD